MNKGVDLADLYEFLYKTYGEDESLKVVQLIEAVVSFKADIKRMKLPFKTRFVVAMQGLEAEERN